MLSPIYALRAKNFIHPLRKKRYKEFVAASIVEEVGVVYIRFISI